MSKNVKMSNPMKVRVCAFHPYYDGSPQASDSPPSGFICVGSTIPGFLMRSRIPLLSI